MAPKNSNDHDVDKMRHFVLVTGASSGIGEAACQSLLTNGYDVIACVRNPRDASRLTTKYGSSLRTVLLDVTDEKQIQQSRAEIERIMGDGYLVALVNNAGIVVSGSAIHIPMKRWHQQFEVNLFGTIAVTQTYFDLLAASAKAQPHPVRIINISSISGRWASPFMGPYAASKFALEAYSDSLRRELYAHNIQVVLIEPGSVKTPIWKKAKEEEVFMGTDHEWMIPVKQQLIEHNYNSGLPVEKISDCILEAVRRPKVRARYLLRNQAWKFRLLMLLPSGWVDRMIHKKLRGRMNIRPL